MSKRGKDYSRYRSNNNNNPRNKTPEWALGRKVIIKSCFNLNPQLTSAQVKRALTLLLQPLLLLLSRERV
jgi:hypothetical protein